MGFQLRCAASELSNVNSVPLLGTLLRNMMRPKRSTLAVCPHLVLRLRHNFHHKVDNLAKSTSDLDHVSGNDEHAFIAPFLEGNGCVSVRVESAGEDAMRGARCKQSHMPYRDTCVCDLRCHFTALAALAEARDSVAPPPDDTTSNGVGYHNAHLHGSEVSANAERRVQDIISKYVSLYLTETLCVGLGNNEKNKALCSVEGCG